MLSLNKIQTHNPYSFKSLNSKQKKINTILS